MVRITADDKIPFLKVVLEPHAQVSYLPGSQIDRNTALNSDALLIRTRTKCNSGLLQDTPVRFIGTATIGYDHIDTEFCESHNIKWRNAPGCNSSSVQQYIVSALMHISGENGFSLKGKTLGIVGVGNVGSKVAKAARVLGMKVLLNDPPRERREGSEGFTGLDEILRESDIITLHVPLTREGEDRTWHMLDRETFRTMRKGVWLINSSRGEVIAGDVLKDALSEELLAGAVIDVWEKEPEIDTSLMHMTFIATPHIAGYSADGKANGTSMVVRHLSNLFGFPLTDWYPGEIPSVAEPVFTIDCEGKSAEDVARRAVLHTYNIVEDDIRLRFDPSRFEKERETYPVRREFPFYTIQLKDGTPEIEALLRDLGFTLA